MKFLLLKKRSCQESATSLLKVLLEQGNPFPPSVGNSNHLKHLLGTYLLMRIILSNCYKNTIVYNMVVLRNRITYKSLTELGHDKIRIYSRINYIPLDESAATDDGFLKINPEFRNNTVRIMVEVQAQHRSTKYTGGMRTEGEINETNLVKSGLLRMTQVFPNVGEISSNFLKNEISIWSLQARLSFQIN